MIEAIALDASPLGRLVHPRLNTEISSWIDEALDMGITIYIPEIIDCEVRHARQAYLVTIKDIKQVHATGT